MLQRNLNTLLPGKLPWDMPGDLGNSTFSFPHDEKINNSDV